MLEWEHTVRDVWQEFWENFRLEFFFFMFRIYSYVRMIMILCSVRKIDSTSYLMAFQSLCSSREP